MIFNPLLMCNCMTYCVTDRAVRDQLELGSEVSRENGEYRERGGPKDRLLQAMGTSSMVLKVTL